MTLLEIYKDNEPYILADKSTVVFGFGEDAIEYSWQEIVDVVRADFDNYKNKRITS